MKSLYFTACAHLNVAPALAGQTHETLGSFTAYLKSAIAAAKKRQARSVCRWEKAAEAVRLNLVPLDSVGMLVAKGFSYLVEGFTGDPPTMELFVGRKYRPIQPLRTVASAYGIIVDLAEKISLGETVHWAGQRCTLRPNPFRWPDKLVARRADGSFPEIKARRESPFRLTLVVEGRASFYLDSESGDALEFERSDPSEGATHLQGLKWDFPWTGDRVAMVPSLPDTEVLLADNGVRWAWSLEEGARRRKQGVWIQLLPPDETDPESTVDSRTVYFDEGVRELRTSDGDVCKVYGSRRASYQLEIDHLPTRGSTLILPANTSGLNRQRDAVFRIKDSPLPHQRGLLRLCENPQKVEWARCRREPIKRWYLLDDDKWQGTDEQREFVEKALGTPDFAFLEGPPGSGKTHAICELILQLIEQGQRVLLCSTTHVAVDNVLERLVDKFKHVEAVRIGISERVDSRVRHVQIDERIDALVQTWMDKGVFPELDDERTLERVAESTILGSVNLTCGTTTGILRHPCIRRADDGRNTDNGPKWPHFDIVILDEASKTTFQEFLVPAQLARRWIIVGDVRQLPPFSEPKDLEASLTEVNDQQRQDGEPSSTTFSLPQAYQRALLIIFRLQRREAGYHHHVRWLIEEPKDVIFAMAKELATRRANGGENIPEVVRITATREFHNDLLIEEIKAGKDSALQLLTADWILLPQGLRSGVERWIPANALPLCEYGPASLGRFRFERWHQGCGRFAGAVRDKNRRSETASTLLEAQRTFFGEETWAKQVAWRIGRVHQLATARNERQRVVRQSETDALMPAATPYSQWVPSAVAAIRDVGVRSVIEALRVERTDPRARKRSALTDAVPSDVWQERAVLLTHQHRMHPDISGFPRSQFYEGSALLDANTLDGRDERDGWGFQTAAPKRRVWIDVNGREERGVNAAEIEEMRVWLEAFCNYARGNRHRANRDWDVACLSFYNSQVIATRDMLRRVSGLPRGETQFTMPNTSIRCATVDRFQGREADVVLLSLRNIARPGHMDSPNRLNVGITRARFFLGIFGNRRFFSERHCRSEELRSLAMDTPIYRIPLDA